MVNSNFMRTSRMYGNAGWLIWFLEFMLDVREVVYTVSNFLHEHFNTSPTVHCTIDDVTVLNFLYFSVLTATYGPSQSSPRKTDRWETEDADIRSKDTGRSMSRDGRTAGLHWESLQVRRSYMKPCLRSLSTATLRGIGKNMTGHKWNHTARLRDQTSQRIIHVNYSTQRDRSFSSWNNRQL